MTKPGNATFPPIGAAEFADLMRSVLTDPEPQRLAVAVSGGRDSMALCLLASIWADSSACKVIALTVDHRLRPGSRAEAAQVKKWLKTHGIEHRTLTWRGEKPTSNLQAAARTARYGLMADWCRRHRVAHVLLAHHLEDQAETLLLRLGRGSGVDGLSAMMPVSRRNDLFWLRPLLDMPRARLEATLVAAGQSWLDDPSNRDPAYSRVRMRNLAESLAAEGLTPARLAETAISMRRARQALEHATEAAIRDLVELHPGGFCLVDRDGLAELPEEIGLRLLRSTLRCIGTDAVFPTRFQRLRRLYMVTVADGPMPSRTLSGCRIAPWRGRLLVARETAKASEQVPIGPVGTATWDNRFRVRVTGVAGGDPDLMIRRLGFDRPAWLRGDRPDLSPSRFPASARAALPGLWLGRKLIAAPHFTDFCGERAADSPRLVAEFRPLRPLVP